MGKVAFLFSGQGAQYPGMGRAWYESSDAARTLFDAAEKERPGTLELVLASDEETLRQTANTQPALYLVDLAAALTAKEAGVSADAVAGFSLGEIPALAFAGAYSPLDGFRLACRRGELMGLAAAKADTGMAAVVKLDNETVEALCREHEQIYPVNYNCDGQLVVSGLKSELPAFCEAVKAAGGRAIPLKVGGAFHSPFMDEASVGFGEVLANFSLVPPVIPAYSNYTAQPYAADSDLRDLLQKQINHPVKWARILNAMANAGIDTFIETGVGTVLTGLVKKVLPEATALSCQSPEELTAVTAALGL